MTHLIIEVLCYQLVFPIIYKPYDHKAHFLLIKSKIQPFEFDTSPHVGQDSVHVLITRLSICFTVSEYK